MNTAARLAKLEDTLSPKEATLAWLTDAHQFPSLAAYVAWLVDQPVEAAPFWRVPEQTERAVRTAMRGEPRTAVEAAAHKAVRDAVFLVELVIRLNIAAEETIRIEGLRYAALFWEMRALTAEAELERGTDGSGDRRPVARRAAAWRAAVSGWLTDLAAAEEARRLLKRRYLDGRRVLFPDLGRDWEKLRESGEQLAALGDLLPGLRDGTSRKERPARPHSKPDRRRQPGCGAGGIPRRRCPRSGARSAGRRGGGRGDRRATSPLRAAVTRGPRWAAPRRDPTRSGADHGWL